MTPSVVILGASGFSGGELARLLLGHPALSLVAVGAHSSAGAPLAEVHPHLSGATDLELRGTGEVLGIEADICFSCLPSGVFAALETRPAAGIVVDLADDFRGAPEWTYGLTEFARAEVAATAQIANPGCYPTATLLCLLPFARAGLIEAPIVVDALSGTSGAGRGPEDRLMFSTAGGSAGAYGTTEHRHVPEMERGLRDLGDLDVNVSFTPHLVPMTRGLVVTARARLASPLTDAKAHDVLIDAFAKDTFVNVVTGWPQTKAVAGTNYAHVSAHVDARNGWVICSAAIDNLGKGAAGQALQNANLALGLEESLGLEGRGIWP